MGGRGSSSGSAAGMSGGNAMAGIKVTYDSGRVQTFRVRSDGKLTDFDLGRPINSKLSLNEIAANAESKGYTVETFTKKDLARLDKERHDRRASKPDYELGVGIPGGNTAHRKAARQSRLQSRVSRRRG